MTVAITPRLILRELNPDDAPFILELLNEADFIRFIGDRGVQNLDDAREYIRAGPVDSYGRHGFGLYAVCQPEGAPLGMCGLVKREGLSEPDLGFAFLARHRSKGYALEAARAVLDLGRKTHELRRVLAVTTPDNDRCIALLEKAGFVFERMIKLGNDPENLKLFSSVSSGIP